MNVFLGMLIGAGKIFPTSQSASCRRGRASVPARSSSGLHALDHADDQEQKQNLFVYSDRHSNLDHACFFFGAKHFSLEHLDLALHHGHLFFAGRYVYRSSV